jgi:hypothetical protein
MGHDFADSANEKLAGAIAKNGGLVLGGADSIADAEMGVVHGF